MSTGPKRYEFLPKPVKNPWATPAQTDERAKVVIKPKQSETSVLVKSDPQGTVRRRRRAGADGGET